MAGRRRQPNEESKANKQPGGKVALEVLEPRVLLSTLTFTPDSDGLDDAMREADAGARPLEMTLDAAEPLLAEAPAADELRSELVFVDTGVEGHEALVADIRASTSTERSLEVFLLDGDRDGVEQISDILTDYVGVDAIHIVSHGTDGAAQLGNAWLSGDSLSSYEASLDSWADALSQDADLLFYGCDLAGGESGEALLGSLAKLTGADVAASSDLTGAAALGGDWDLEYSVGQVESSVAFSAEVQQGWGNVLNVGVDATSTGTTTGLTATISHTTASAGDRLMLVGVSSRPVSGETVSSVTYDGVALDFVGAQNGPSGARVEIWSLVAPDLGTHDVVVTMSAGTHGGVTAGVMTYTGVDQTTPLGTFASGSGDGATGSVTVTSAADELVFGVLSIKDVDNELVPGVDQTERWDLFTGSEANGGGSTALGAASVDMSWTWTNSTDWAIGGVSINATDGPTAVIAVDDGYSVGESAVLNTDSTWFDTDWQYRRTLSFDNATRGENLTDFPVLIELDGSKIDYTKTHDTGDDLRFFDQDGTALAHEIEEWNEGGTSYVWVKVPQIDASSSTDSIVMYYGNAGVVGNGQDAAGVWTDYRAVYHMDGDPGAAGTVDDAAGNFDATNSGSTNTTGAIGDAQDFNGIDQHIDLGDDRGWINGETASSLSIWMNADTVAGGGDLIGLTRNDPADTGASRITLIRNGDDILMIARTMDDGSDSVSVTTSTNPLSASQWHHVTGTVDYASDVDNIKIYVDGELEGTFSHNFTNNAIPNTDSSHATIGSDEDGTSAFFDGQLDEARISAKLRSAEWVSAQHASMTDSFVTVGYEQTVAGVLVNDIDPNGDLLTVTELNGNAATVGVQTELPSGALLTLNSDGTFIYDTNGAFESLGAGDSTTEVFTYTVDDGNGNTDTGTVTVTINGENDAPIFIGGSKGYWHFDEGAGGTTEDVAQNNAGVLGSTAGADTNDPTWTAGLFDGALHFDGIDDYVEVAEVPGIDISGPEFSASFWMKPDSGPNKEDMLFMKGDRQGNVNYYLSWKDTGKMTWAFKDSGGWQYLDMDVTLPATGEWNHIAVVFDRPTVSLYINGDKYFFDNVATGGSMDRDLTANDEPLWIGAGRSGGSLVGVNDWSGPFSGSIDEFAIFDRALTDSEIYAIRTSAPSVATATEFAIDENSANDTIVGTVAATDQDAADVLSYAITGGNTSGAFSIDASGTIKVANSGALDFESSPIFTLTVEATDNGAPNLASSTDVTITLNDMNDAPVITSDGGAATAAINVAENSTAVTTVTTTDADLDTPTFSITGGADQGRFSIDPDSGVLTFNSAPDFEAPGDVGANNIYEVEITADDGNGGTDVQTISVTIDNVSPVGVDDAYAVDSDATLDVAWWDTAWTQRQQLTLDNLGQTETLTDFPVLIVLNSGNIDYSQTNDDGSDLRFFAADGTPLAFEIEEWNEGGDSSVWVRVPQITGSSATDSISMYYGNAAAGAVASDGSVWDDDFVGVWHLDQDQAGTGNTGVYADSTGNGHDGTDHVAATGQEGQVTDGQQLGANDWIEIDHDPSLDLKDSMTISFWIKPDSDMGTFNRVVEKGLWGYNNSYYFGGGNGTNDLTFYLNGQEVIDTADGVLTVGQWQHAAVSYTSNGDGTGTATMYLDGAAIASGNYTNGAVVGNASRLAIGHSDPLYDIDGSVDEVQISKTARSADWIAAQYQATKNQVGGEFVQFPVSPETAPAGAGVLANDSFDDVATSIASNLDTTGTLGLVTLNSDGTFSYDPNGQFDNLAAGATATDTFTYDVTDAGGQTDTATVTITITGVNDAPALANNGLTISEGGTVILSGTDLSATDAETAAGLLDFTVSSVTGGQFELVASPGSAITTFTQQQILDGDVQFVHAGGEAAPTYSVTVSDGALSDGPQAATIGFTNINDAPALANNGLTISEGGTVILSGTDLSATDAETAAGLLDFTVSSVTGGQFELVASPGTAITTFTQQQILDGDVQFVHGGGEAAPTYSVTVSDGALSDGPQAGTISFTNINDAPALANNGLTISEGGTVILSGTDLSATDAETAAGLLDFTVSSITGGQFELVTSPGSAITTFTQQQILDGEIQFVHAGGEAAPTYSVAVSDGALSDGPQAATISFTNINDAPALANNGLTISEGGTVILSGTDLSATDAETAAGLLDFTVSSVTGGQFELVASPGSAITTFTQQQILDGDVQFVHAGGEAAPTYSVTVSDGALSDGPQAATIGFTNINDAPALANNGLTISEGGTVILSGTDLSATDAETSAGLLDFTVSSVTGGQFELVASPGTAITTFTQQQILDGDVQFVHAGGEAAPTYSVTVSDGALSDGPQAATISFTNLNDAPALANNGLTISEGGTVILSGTDLSATDVETAAGLLDFTVSSVTGGQFELVASPGSAITTFTQQQILDGDVQFVHAGGEAAPTYSVTVSDGALSDGPQAATISFSNINDAPALANNGLTISEGGTVILSGTDLSATDVETAAGLLDFTVSSVTGGQFELVASPGTAITTFTQQQILDGDVQFVHAGGEAAPTYSVTVSDGALSDGPQAATISFTNLNDAPAVANNGLTISEGGTVILSATDLSATDAETAAGLLDFTVSSVTGGQFELVASPGSAITTFTQQQILDGEIQFVHAGGEAAPTYSVTVSDGALSDGPQAATISFTNLNDAPALATNGLTISEGGTVILSGTDLSATDAETAAGLLDFTVSSITGGQFELVASPGSAITTFTQQQILDGDVQFVHAGGEAAPTYSVTVSDGALSDGPQAATISFTNLNDAPALANNGLTISEGGTVILSSTDLSATDVETTAGLLDFTVSSVTGGHFELVASPGSAITTFTQQQILDGDVQFVHAGGEAAPTYSVAVSDGALSDGPQAGTISFTNINDAPALANNGLTISEGGTVILSGTDLSATDVETAAGLLDFTVSSVTGGQFELVASPGTAITTFTQQQILDGDVQFVHAGGEAAPTYSVAVSDGALSDGPHAATISFTNINDAPALANNGLTISEGGTVILSGTDLSATDVETAAGLLDFTVSSVTGGQFELVASPGTAITTFTQQQILDGDVQFVHAGGEAAPTYSVTVSDGALSDGPQAATVSFSNVNDAPALANNGLTISEGDTVILSGTDLSATDAETTAGLLDFTVSSVTGGRFELVASPGSAITTFTQQQILDGDVQFVHAGGEAAPTYSVTVSDGALSDGPQAGTISFTNINDAPALANNGLTISEGGTVILSGTDLSATDAETAAGLLDFTVSSVTGGQFELVASPGSAITTFTQQQILDGDVQFVHAGGEAAPTYSVTVSDGALSDGPQAATISFTNINDAPALATNGLTISEGGTVILSGTDLSATDAETTAGLLDFTVSSVTGGRFELVASPGSAITTFTQQQILDGDVQFVHAGGEAAPTYSVTVSDGALSDGPQAGTISFTNINDAPALANNGLTISEGGTVILSGTDLSATDAETAAGLLDFTVSSVTGGQFELVASPGSAITTFTQQQILDGDVQFVHAGGEAAPTYSVTVSDGALSDGPQAGTISFTNINDAPALANNGLTISEGGTVILSGTDLSATDAETAAGLLDFTVSSVTGGQFELVASPGSAITTFTQQQILDGDVQFVHGGGEAAPTYSVTVSDGALSDGPQAATISFTNINDAPALANNGLTISEGGTVILSGTDLSATDAETAAGLLDFTVSSVTGGQFELVASPGSAITTFTQQQILDGDVQFVHGGGEAAPTYSVTVSDGALSDGPQAATISFTNINDAPVLATNGLTISEGDTVILSGTDLSATDAETTAGLLDFTVSSVTGGQFELVASPGSAITTFTQQQILDGDVQFVHGGGEAAPTYSVTVSDGALSDGPQAATIGFTNINDAPAVANNGLTISEGGTVILSGTDLSATDAETAAGLLDFTVSSVTGGQFELVASPGSAITTFTQQQILDGDVQFVHGGGEAAPTYSVTVSDGALSDGPQAATVSFSNVNDAPALANNGLTISEGGTVILSATDLSASDAETAAGLLDFTVSSATGGQFELVASPGSAITTFTQQQILDGDVQFVHAGGEAAPTYSVTVSDGALSDGPHAATVSFTNINDAPVLATNGLTISEGDTVILSGTDLSATDAETAAGLLDFTISSITGGQFELVASPGTAITTFDQQQILDGEVQFVHAGGEAAPTYSVTISDGILSDGPHAATISFTNLNDAPVIADQLMSIDENSLAGSLVGTVIASDSDAGDSIAYSISSGNLGGAFAIDPSTGDLVVADASLLDFETNPSIALVIEAEDLAGTVSSATVTVSISNVNEAVTATAPSIVLMLEGESLVLSSSAGNGIVIGDPDGASASLEVTLTASGGSMTLASSSGLTMLTGTGSGDAVVSFQGTLADVQTALDGMTFDAAGGALAASIDVNVTDLGAGGVSASTSLPIDVSPVLPTPANDTDSSDDSDPADREDPSDEDSFEDEADAPSNTPDEDAPAIVPSLESRPKGGGSSQQAPHSESIEGTFPTSSIALGGSDAVRMADRDAETSAKIDPLRANIAQPEYLQALDQMRRDVLEFEDRETEADSKWVVPTIQSIVMAASSGLLALILRGGSLLAMAVSSVPLWNRVDPLMILSLSEDERKDLEVNLRDAGNEEQDLDALLSGQADTPTSGEDVTALDDSDPSVR